jgi:antitoxin (DNA-binding transcriptional repressor) of toxin-antitoxin stability system
MIDPGRVQRAGWGGKMAEAIELEKVDEHGKPVKRLMACQPQKPRQGKKQLADTMGIMVSSDDDDRDYDDLPPLESVVTSDSESDPDGTLPSNAEVFIITVLLFHCDIRAYPAVDC